AVCGPLSAPSSLMDGGDVTLSCAEGEHGAVYREKLAFTVDEVDGGTLPQTRTELMTHSADPGRAFHWWRWPAKGVGLARMEFIIGNMIKAHPMALAHPDLV